MNNTRAQAWVFTINNYTFDDLQRMMECGNQRYLCFGFEVGEKGTPHVQGYIYMENTVYFDSMRHQMHRARLEPAKGNSEQNQLYTSKEGDWYEFGDVPSQGRATWDKICKAMENPKENFQLYTQYRKAYREVIRNEGHGYDRKLYLVPFEDRYKYAKQASSCFDGTLETYDEESYVFVEPYVDKWIIDWKNGFPPKIKRGYEIIPCDPTTVYLMYREGVEKRYFKRKFEGYISKKNAD